MWVVLEQVTGLRFYLFLCHMVNQKQLVCVLDTEAQIVNITYFVPQGACHRKTGNCNSNYNTIRGTRCEGVETASSWQEV